MKAHGKTLASLGAAVLCFVIIQHIAFAVMTCAYRVYITAEIDHEDVMQLYYTNSEKKPEFKEQYSDKTVEVFQPNEKILAEIEMGDAPVMSVRLDPGHKPGVVKLYEIEVVSHLAKPIIYTPSDIYRLFKPGKDDITVSLEKDHVRVESRLDDPFLMGTEPLIKINKIVPYGIALLISTVLFGILYRFDYATFPPFYDIARKKPTIGVNIDALDGLRGLAAIIIIADHTYGKISGIGAIGVWLFMTLSGFLMARPFILHPERATSFSFWENFFLRRVKRIIPLYYSYIVAIYVMTGRYDEAFRHFFFLQGDGVLWVINQEMVFYLMVPFIMLLNYFVFRGKIWPILINTFILIFVSYYYVGRDVISMYGMHNLDLRLYANIFLSGIFFSYLYYGVFEPSSLYTNRQELTRKVFSFIGILLLVGFMLGTTNRMWGGEMIYGIVYDHWFGLAAGLFIFCIVTAQNSKLEKLLTWMPLKACGLVSFSMYLLHPLVVHVLRQSVPRFSGHSLTDLTLFLVTVVVTYMVSCMTYTYIERPFTR